MSENSVPPIAQQEKSVPPRFSVLIPTFNAVRFLPTTLRSVAKQLGVTVEVIVMDGGSSDGTVELARSFDKLNIRAISESDLGQLHAVQKAAKIASGDILYWLNADDVLLPGSLRVVSDAFYSDPALDLVFSDDFVFNSTDRTLYNGGLIKGLNYLDHSLFYRQMYSECIFWRREKTKYLPAEYYDLRIVTDYAFFLNLRFGLKERWLKKRLGAFRVVPDQLSAVHRARLPEEFERVRNDAYRRVGWSLRSIPTRRTIHKPSFWVRQVLRPAIHGGARALARRLDGGKRRRRMTAAFFDEWLESKTPPTEALTHLLYR